MKKDGNSLEIVTLTKGGQRSLVSFEGNSGVISVNLQVHKLSFTSGKPIIQTTELRLSRDGGTGLWIRSRNKSDTIASRVDTRSGEPVIGRKRGRPKKSAAPTPQSTNSSDPQEKELGLLPEEVNSVNP